MAWTGLLVGLVFGIILQRGRVCFNSAFRDVLLFKDNYLWKLGFLAVGLQMITVLFVAQMGWIRIAPPTLNLFGNIVGAYVFGWEWFSPVDVPQVLLIGPRGNDNRNDSRGLLRYRSYGNERRSVFTHKDVGGPI